MEKKKAKDVIVKFKGDTSDLKKCTKEVISEINKIEVAMKRIKSLGLIFKVEVK